ncbi:MULTISPECIES: hypothetical protein [Microbacterium]|uniref:hypothetical protein n=1 Tax=Microbacterium TaxID=33882 RepID=UPI0011EAF8C4|nr:MULTISPECIES: hypothetical protein [Microbacterium]
MTRAVRSFRTGIAVPGVVLRLVAVALAAGGALLLVPFPLWRGVAVLAALVAVAIPRSLAAWAALACLPFGVILSEPDPGRTALALLFVHALHVCASLSLVVPLSSRVALSVLLPSAARLLAVQAIAQPLAFAVWLLAERRDGTAVVILAPLAAAALLGEILIALRAAERAEEAASGARTFGVLGADVRGPS